MSVPWVLMDFETSSACDLKAAGAWRYAEDPTTEVLCLSYTDGNDTWVWLPEQPPDERLLTAVNDPKVIFVAFNVAFEKSIWRRIMVEQFGWPDIPNGRWHDVQAVCAMRVLPLALEDAVRVLSLSHQKDMEGAKILRELMKPGKRGWLAKTPEKLARLYDYCKADVAAELDLHLRMGWLPPGERNVWLLDQRINERGLHLDQHYITQARKIVDAAIPPLAAEFRSIVGYNFGQRDKVLDWLHGCGVPMRDLRKETVVEVLGKDIDAEEDSNAGEIENIYQDMLTPEVRRALEIRQLVNSASIKKLARMEACVCADSRARGLLQYHGTGPGRRSGRLLQPQNFPRPTIELDDKPIDFQYVVDAILTGDAEYVNATIGPPVETVVSGLRHAVTASRGRVLVSGDYAGIQARVVLALAGQHDKTALMAAGKDIYCDMAEQIYKRPIDRKKDPAERQVGKNSVLGLGFQMGWRKFKLKYAREHTDEFCETVVTTYRKEWAPCVPKLWYGLEGAAVKAVWEGGAHEAFGVEYKMFDQWLTARLPSGRLMWYFNPRKVRKAMPWDANDVRLGFTYDVMKMGQWTTVTAFGGLLTENVVMGIERDIMVDGMFGLEAAGLPVVLDVHDEVVIEPLEAQADAKVFREIMLDVKPWVRQLQIPVDVPASDIWIGERYRK